LLLRGSFDFSKIGLALIRQFRTVSTVFARIEDLSCSTSAERTNYELCLTRA
jgi:hypothetical protein